MQDWGRIEPHVACFSDANLSSASFNHLLDLIDRDTPACVRTGCDQERSVCGRDVVQMNPQRDHTGQQMEGRSDVLHAGLHRPWPEAVDIDLLLNADRAILMPRQRPVCLGRLVEQDCSDRTTCRAEHARCDQADRSVRSEEMPQCLHAADADACVLPRQGAEQGVQAAQILRDGATIQLRSVPDKSERGGSIRNVHDPARPTNGRFLLPGAAKPPVRSPPYLAIGAVSGASRKRPLNAGRAAGRRCADAHGLAYVYAQNLRCPPVDQSEVLPPSIA